MRAEIATVAAFVPLKGRKGQISQLSWLEYRLYCGFFDPTISQDLKISRLDNEDQFSISRAKLVLLSRITIKMTLLILVRMMKTTESTQSIYFR